MGNFEPFVTIAVCTYNRQDEITACLSSLCQQSYGNFEILIVDDGSTDRTVTIVKDFFATSPDVSWRTVTHDKNRGLYSARNTACKEARGEIVAFLDTDCIADQNWILHLVTGFKDGSVVIVGGHVDDFFDGTYIQMATKGIYGYTRMPFGSVDYVIGCNMASRRDFLIDNQLTEEESYGNDDREWCEMARIAGFNILHVPSAKVLHKHRQTIRSLIQQQFLSGVSSPKFRNKYGYFPLNYRAIQFIAVFLSLALQVFSREFITVTYFFILLFIVTIIARDIMSKAKRSAEIIITLPVTFLVGAANAAGSIIGLLSITKLRR